MRRRHLVALAISACATLASPAVANAAVVWDSTPPATPANGNVASLGYEATQTDEFGGQVELVGTDRQNPQVTVTMSSWACESGTWNAGNCATNPGATFSHPVTLNLYNVGPGNEVGSLIATTTQTFNIPYRPSANPGVCGNGRWSADGTAANCFNGFATNITFNRINGVTLPNRLIASVAYNTSTSGNAPLGTGTACFGTAAGCPYDALNVGTWDDDPAVGDYPFPGDAYWDHGTTQAPPNGYCDSGASGTDSFRFDGGCDNWVDFQPALRIDAVTPSTGGTSGGSGGVAGAVGNSAALEACISRAKRKYKKGPATQTRKLKRDLRIERCRVQFG